MVRNNWLRIAPNAIFVFSKSSFQHISIGSYSTKNVTIKSKLFYSEKIK
ncbi:hypothetical protein QW060_24785 [Myroides ceti]|uniref:Uncharacterized protein n=1 Tax=Paenimyroides ceti TaxID=395087 RepID=A0ABT8D2H4_9FLAO|nr:hypothetical protein [Paenimyroides ceti]MDN3710108.1 hypothetical protein [Paenimyroides ceti]